LAQEVLKRPNVRLGHCIGNLVTGLPGRADGPAHATAAGLLIHAVRSSADPLDLEEPDAPEGFFGRVGAWLNKYL
jgi:hypothetical protein